MDHHTNGPRDVDLMMPTDSVPGQGDSHGRIELILPAREGTDNASNLTRTNGQGPNENLLPDQHWTAGQQEHQQEAQAAFSENSGVVAVTPRQSVWTGRHLLTDSQDKPFPWSFGGAVDDAPADGFERAPMSQEGEWQPSLAIGSINADKISAKEAARRHVLQWDQIVEYNRIHNPGSLRMVEEQRIKAQKVYEDISARGRAEDLVPKNELQSYQSECVESRSALLRKTLNEITSYGSEHMRVNIMTALDGYDSGNIGFSNTYTLIYAGHIVDTTCTTYAEFTVDRQERLDRYFKQYGTGYLWWEPPLARSKGRVLAKKGTVLELDREGDIFYSRLHGGARFRDDSCHYKVSLGFKKDDSLRYRKHHTRKRGSTTAVKRRWECLTDKDEEAIDTKHKRPTGSPSPYVDNVGQIPQQNETKSIISMSFLNTFRGSSSTPGNRKTEGIDQDANSPTIFFDMLLDSGAEIPILLHDDFHLLGYTKDDMNAATVVELNAAAGQVSMGLCFELLVGLDLHGSATSSPVDGGNRRPEAHFFPTRVIKLDPSVKAPPFGTYSGDRLSGILPFLAYYVSSAPGRDTLCLGDERVDVLGMHKLPAGLEYDPFIKRQGPGQVREILKQTGQLRKLSKVIFEHEVQRGKRLVDQDIVGQEGEEPKNRLMLLDKDREVVDFWDIDSEKNLGRE